MEIKQAEVVGEVEGEGEEDVTGVTSNKSIYATDSGIRQGITIIMIIINLYFPPTTNHTTLKKCTIYRTFFWQRTQEADLTVYE
jgi:hypothetical protein